MSRKYRNLSIAVHMRSRFLFAAFFCFAAVTVFSLLLYFVCKNVSEWEEAGPDPEAAALAEQIDALAAGPNEGLEEMKASYEKLTARQKAQVTQVRYDRLLEAEELNEALSGSQNYFSVADQSGGPDLAFMPGNRMRLKKYGSVAALEGQTDVKGEAFDRLFNKNQPFTIEADVNPNGWGYGKGDFNMIASKGDNCVSLRISNQSVYFHIKNTSGMWVGEEIRLSEEQMNSWNHIAAVYNGNDIMVYVEGYLPKTVEQAGAVNASNYPLGIGYCPETGRISTNGIRGIRVYSRALSVEELDARACRPQDPAVELWYDFGDYSCPDVNLSPDGIRSVRKSVKTVPGEELSLAVEPIPYYTKGKITYQVDREEVALVSEDGVLMARTPGTALVTAAVEGTGYSVTIPVSVKDAPFGIRNAAGWAKEHIVLLAFLSYVVCLAVLIVVQRQQLLCCLAELSEAVFRMGKGEEDILLPPVLQEAQAALRETKDSLRQKEQTIREVERRKNDMVVYLAHDLKTPIASMIGYLALLQEQEQIPDNLRQRYLGIVSGSAQRLNDLIDEFFEVARFNMAHLTLAYTKIDIVCLLEQMVYEFKPILAEKDLTVRLDAPEKLYLSCDADKMERVFDNLLKNAVSYSFPGTQIVLSLSAEERIGITFTNCGNTIPQEKLVHLFEQFYRLDSARAGGTGGSGLGLAIAKQIVDAHHGEITAGSRDGKIWFTVLLPRDEITS